MRVAPFVMSRATSFMLPATSRAALLTLDREIVGMLAIGNLDPRNALNDTIVPVVCVRRTLQTGGPRRDGAR